MSPRELFRSQYRPHLRWLQAQQIARNIGNLLLAAVPHPTIERPSHANTPRVYRRAAIGALIVTASAFITSTVAPGYLAAIPAYLAYVTATLGIRRMQLT
jgi:hypothetical protein